MKSKIVIHKIIFSFLIFLCAFIPASGQVQSLKDAWKQYNAAEKALSDKTTQMAISKFDSAIGSSNLCITDFKNDARRMQANSRLCPPIGKVSAADGQRILQNWALNDVATAAFIKGKSAKYLIPINPQNRSQWERERDEARALVQELPYGRSLDLKQGFWSPCKALLGENVCCPN